MKWLGQYIQDLPSRFRDDVYLESISTGTIASDGHLGLDSNNKIVKAEDGGGDLTSIVAGTGLSGTSLTGPIPTLNVDASLSHLSSIILDVNKDVTPGDGAVIHVDSHDVTDTNTSASGTAAMYTHINIEHPRLLATNASVTTTAAASLYIKGAPTASTNQTITNPYALWVDDGLVKFDGALTVGGTITGDVTGNLTGDVIAGDDSAMVDSSAKTFTGALTGNVTGQADTVATIAGLAPNTATTQATQPNIDSIGTDGDTLSILGDSLNMANTTASKPQVSLINQADDTTGPVILLQNQRVDSSIQAGEDGDVLGRIYFKGYNDGTPALKQYAGIYSDIHDATTGEESGRLTFQVANHDGGSGSGLILTGGSEDNEINVTVGLGANSVVTVPGQILAPNGGMGARHYGNTIKILPQDFMKNDDSSGNALNYKDAATGGVQVDNNSLEAICFVAIPEGMKATHVDMYATANVDVIVHEESISSNVAWSGGSAATDLAGGSGAANTQIDLSADVNSTATNMLAIKVTLTSTSQRIWGGTVTIAAI